MNKFSFTILIMSSYLLNISCTNTTNNETKEHVLFPIERVHRDSAVQITFDDLEFLLEKATDELSKTTDISNLDENEHVLIVMLQNTHSEIGPKDISRVKDRYEAFYKEFYRLDYEIKLAEEYKWELSRGMNMYFPKLEIGNGGCLNGRWNCFDIQSMDKTWKVNY